MSIYHRTPNVETNSQSILRKSVRYKVDDRRREQMTPVKKVIKCNSESSSVNSIPGLDWDSQVVTFIALNFFFVDQNLIRLK